jgi:hypothetical protein
MNEAKIAAARFIDQLEHPVRITSMIASPDYQRVGLGPAYRPAPIIDADDVRPLTNPSDPLIGFVIFTACMFIAFCTFVGFVDVWHRVFG